MPAPADSASRSISGAPAPAALPAALSAADVKWIMLGLMLSMVLGALDQTIVATALPTIGRDLNDLEHMSWVVTAYLLAATAVTPLYGKLADIRGRRFALIVAIILFLVGSTLCALSPTMLVLIGARALQGFGGGGLIALSQTVIADIIPPRERPKYQAYIAGVFATSSIVGPVLGGFLAQSVGWAAIFWINLPIGFAAMAMAGDVLRKLPRHDRPHRMDFAGALLLMAATVALLLALNWGGTRYAWLSAEILGLVAGSAVLWALFVWRITTADEPLMSVTLLQNGVVRNAVLAAFFGVGSFIGLTIFVPVFFQTVMHLGAGASGLALIPFTIGTVAGATFSGRYMVRIRHYKLIPIVGLIVSILATLALIVLAGRLSIAAQIALLFFISASGGTLFPVTTVAVQNAVEGHEMGTATGLANFLRSLGGAFIVALYGAILLAVAGEGSMTGDAPQSALEAAAALTAFRYVFAAAAVGFALALGFFLLMEERPWRGTTKPAPSPVEH